MARKIASGCFLRSELTGCAHRRAGDRPPEGCFGDRRTRGHCQQRAGSSRIRRVDRARTPKTKKISVRSHSHGWRSDILDVSARLARFGVAEFFRRAEFHDERGAKRGGEGKIV